MQVVTNVQLTPGYLVITLDNGTKHQIGVADMLRAADIPTGLTYVQVDAIKTLANLNAVLIRTLIDRGILDNDFLEEADYDLAAITDTIESLGGDYVEPDLTVP